jgi:hypothetical protein
VAEICWSLDSKTISAKLCFIRQFEVSQPFEKGCDGGCAPTLRQVDTAWMTETSSNDARRVHDVE